MKGMGQMDVISQSGVKRLRDSSDSEDEPVFAAKKKKKCYISDDDEEGGDVAAAPKVNSDIQIEHHVMKKAIEDESSNEGNSNLLPDSNEASVSRMGRKKRCHISDDDDDEEEEEDINHISEICQSKAEYVPQKTTNDSSSDDDNVPLTNLKAKFDEHHENKEMNADSDEDDDMPLFSISQQKKPEKPKRKYNKKKQTEVLGELSQLEKPRKPYKKKSSIADVDSAGIDSPVSLTEENVEEEFLETSNIIQKHRKSQTRRASRIKTLANSEVPPEFAEPMQFNSDIFDGDVDDPYIGGDNSEGVAPVDEEDDDIVEKPKKQKKKKEPKPKKEFIPKKAREKEMFEIQSENQRLLREREFKIPYRRAPRYSLDEFLKERQKENSLEKTEKEMSESQSTDSSEIGSSVEKVHSPIDGENTDTPSDNPINSPDSIEATVVDVMTLMLRVVEMSFSDVSNFMDLKQICVQEKASSSVNGVQSVENLLLQELENSPDVLPSLRNRLNFTNKSEVQLLSEQVCLNDNKVDQDTLNGLEDMMTPENVSRKTDRLSMRQRILEAAKAFTPCIKGSPNDIIDFDDDLGVFIEKFVSHTKSVSKKRSPQEVKLSIVSKDSQGGDMKLSEIKVDVHRLGEDDSDAKPGVKLVKLKEQLLDKILQKKEKVLKERIAEGKLDDEIQFAEEEEAEELTEESESEQGDDVEDDNDIVDEEMEEEEDDDDDDDLVQTSSHKKKSNPFADDEASESNDGNVKLNNVHSNSKSKTSNESKESCGSRTSFSGIFPKNQPDPAESNSEDDLLEENLNCRSRFLYFESDSEDNVAKETGAPLNASDFLTALPSHQPDGGFSHNNNQNETLVNSTQIEASTQQEKEMDICKNDAGDHNSQPLFPSQFPSFASSTQHEELAINLSPCVKDLVDPQSQYCVDDVLPFCSGKFTGSFKTPSPKKSREDSDISEDDLPIFNLHSENNASEERETTKLKPSLSAIFDNENAVDSIKDNSFDEFVKPSNPFKVASDLKFSDSVPNVNDALALCSGSFGSRTQPDDFSATEETEDQNVETGSPTAEEPAKRKRKAIMLSDSEDEEDGDLEKLSTGSPFSVDPEENMDEDDVMLEEFEGVQDLNKPDKMNDYFEAEAELSGSDVGSDDENEDDDGHDLEDLIKDDERYSDEDLRNQIGKVHLKRLMDEDKRQLRIYQELYLEDGDLHSDGPGRQRKFTWRNSGVTDDVNGKDGDSEAEEETVAPDEEQWRLERHEREKWLRENESKTSVSDVSPIKIKPTASFKLEIVHKNAGQIISKTPNASGSPSMKVKRGSFLARGEEYLSNLAKRFKKPEDNSTGSRTTKHFVFRAISPTKSPNIDIPKSPVAVPSTSKRVSKVMPLSKKRKSVFDYMD